MRLIRVRFTVRRMMVAVVFVAVILWGFRLRQLAAHYRYQVERCEGGLRSRGVMCYFPNKRSSPEEEKIREKAFDDWLDRRDAYYAKMKLKYERAARYPWLPVAPDPPVPE